MSIRPLLVIASIAASMLVLTGCVPNVQAGGAGSIAVAITDDTCDVATDTAKAGNITFDLTNSGSDINEFEILAEDQLRIVGEKENVVPGSTAFTVQLQPGTYFTACKFQMVGAPIGLAEFTVTGAATAVDAGKQQLIDGAVADYVAYITSQAGELIPAVEAFTDAYVAGDDDAARSLFASTRVFYERIEPTAEAFGDLDPKIDYREVDAVAEGLDWTGFHRMEKDLWPPAEGELNSDGTSALLDWAPSTPGERAELAEGLVTDVQSLYDLVNADDFTVTLADISNGAIGLLDEVAVGKISGEEDWWSHTDLTDFAANVQGAEVAFGNVEAVARSQGEDDLVDSIQQEFDALQSLLAQYGSIEDGFTPYDQVTDAQRNELSDAVNGLAEPLSRLTAAVLG